MFVQQEPYTVSKGSQLEGFCMDLLSEVAKKLGFKYRVQLVRDGAYGRQDESGSWNGMIGEVMRGVSTGKKAGILESGAALQTAGSPRLRDSPPVQRWRTASLSSVCPEQEADLAVAPLTLTAAREKVVAMTTPFMQTGIGILLRGDISEETGLFEFLSPFTAQTWAGVLAAYLATAACIFLVTRSVGAAQRT